jgi:hypothetical protein
LGFHQSPSSTKKELPMKHRQILLITVVVLIGTLLLVERFKANSNESQNRQPMHGRMKLVAKYEPLHLEIYADTDSTEKYAAFEITERGKLLYRRQPESSNKIDYFYLEKTMDLLTQYDLNGMLLKRYVHTGFNNNNEKMTYAYVDTNGDGSFDYLLEYDEHSVRTAAFRLTN